MKNLYSHRKVQSGRTDTFTITMEKDYESPIGIVEPIPIDLTGWTFTLFLHRNVEYRIEDLIYRAEGVISNPSRGKVSFTIPAEITDRKPNTYWYTIQYTKPSGKTYQPSSSKYVIVKSLSDYFDIYNKLR